MSCVAATALVTIAIIIIVMVIRKRQKKHAFIYLKGKGIIGGSRIF